MAPTREELADENGVNIFCAGRKCTPRAIAKMVQLVMGPPTACEMDPRDLRSVATEDRVPRSLETPMSPVGFWDISSPKRVVCSEDEKIVI